MAKKTFNEVEEYVLTEWKKAIALEDALRSVRANAYSVMRRVEQAIEARFDRTYSSPTYSGGCIAFGKSSWARQSKDDVVGLWISQIGIDALSDPDARSPYAAVWGQNVFATVEEATEQKEQLRMKLKATLDTKIFDLIRIEPKRRSRILLWDFSSKGELLSALSVGDSTGFDEILLEQVELFTRMIEILEPHFLDRKNRE